MLVSPVDDRLSRQACIEWLELVTASRDFGHPAPVIASEDRTTAVIIAAIRNAFASFASGFVGYRTLIADARAAVAKSDKELGRVIARSADERETIARAVEIAHAMRLSGTEVARYGDGLTEAVVALRDGIVGAHADVRRISDVVSELDANARSGATLLERLVSGWNDVSSHVESVARSSRQARLLAINAAIEAAHVADGRSGFAIVASEMRTLAQGTLEASGSVRRILGETATSTLVAAREAAAVASAAERMLDRLTYAADVLSTQSDSRDALAGAVEEIAATADQQLATVAALADGAERLSMAASAILVDATEAAELRIAERLAETEALVGRYREVTLDVPVRTHESDEPLARWIDAIAFGIGDASRVPEVEPHLRALAAAAHATMTMLLDDEREIVRRLIELSVAFARNGSRWQSILRSAGGVGTDADSFVTMLEEGNAAATSLAAGFAEVRLRLSSVGDAASGAMAVISEAMAEVVATRAHGDAFQRAIDHLGEATDRTASELNAVTDLSADATLLSINAAIEAAHAGDRGAGFSVIAGEIGKLAKATESTAESIVRDMATLREQSEDVRDTTERGAERLTLIGELAAATAGKIAGLGTIVRDSLEKAVEVADAAMGQVENVEGVLRAFVDLTDALPRMNAAMSPERRAEFATIGTRAHAIASRRKLGFVVEGVLAAAIAAAEEIEDVIAAVVRQGDVSAAAFSALAYERIGTDEPAIYRTGYDEAIRPGVRAVLDRLTEHPHVFSCGVFDLNAYAAVIASKSAAGRERRIWDDLARRPLRVGVESLRPLSDRTTPEELERAGASLIAVKPRPIAVCTYVIDTGAVFNEIGCAIDLLGKRIATLSVLFNAERV